MYTRIQVYMKTYEVYKKAEWPWGMLGMRLDACVAVWLCGCVRVRLSDCVAMRLCGDVVVWQYACVALWL